MRSSIKIPSHSERAVPFPRSSQTRKRRRNISGRSGDPTSGDSPGGEQSVSPAFRVVRARCGCCRQHITPPAAAAAARSGCAPHTTISAALYSVYPEMATVLLPQGPRTAQLQQQQYVDAISPPTSPRPRPCVWVFFFFNKKKEKKKNPRFE